MWTTTHAPEQRALAVPCIGVDLLLEAEQQPGAPAELLCPVEALTPQQAALISPMYIPPKCKLLSSADSLWNRKSNQMNKHLKLSFLGVTWMLTL